MVVSCRSIDRHFASREEEVSFRRSRYVTRTSKEQIKIPIVIPKDIRLRRSCQNTQNTLEETPTFYSRLYPEYLSRTLFVSEPSSLLLFEWELDIIFPSKHLKTFETLLSNALFFDDDLVQTDVLYSSSSSSSSSSLRFWWVSVVFGETKEASYRSRQSLYV